MAESDEEEEVTIHEAAERGDVVEVGRMLDRDPGLMEARDEEEFMWHMTPLITAAQRGHIEVVELLLQRGADINAVDECGWTALHAAANGHVHVVSLLLAQGADASIENNDHEIALIWAASEGHLNVVKRLLEHGQQNIDYGGWFRRTALWTACDRGHAEVAKVLLVQGADHTISADPGVSLRGGTPLEIALQNGHQACVDVMQWFQGELDRAYVLHKARCINSDHGARQLFPSAQVPLYVRGRVAAGRALPVVELVSQQEEEEEEDDDDDDDDDDNEEEGPAAVDEEEAGAVVGFAVGELNPELFVELMEGMRFNKAERAAAGAVTVGESEDEVLQRAYEEVLKRDYEEVLDMEGEEVSDLSEEEYEDEVLDRAYEQVFYMEDEVVMDRVYEEEVLYMENEVVMDRSPEEQVFYVEDEVVLDRAPEEQVFCM